MWHSGSAFNCDAKFQKTGSKLSGLADYLKWYSLILSLPLYPKSDVKC